jgi:transcriptional regulator with XRE-family HTH domain
MAGKKRKRSFEDKASLKGLARAVCELREKKGWDQHELGKRAGLHFTSIDAVERAATELRWANLRRLAEALEGSLPALLHLAEALAPGKGGENCAPEHERDLA